MELSIIVPLYNEEESLPELVTWIDRVVKKMQISHEVILVDDGSTDTSWEVIKQLKTQFPKVQGLKFRRNYGKSAALFCGFEVAKGDVVITMDADLQDSPDEIPELYDMIATQEYDMVSGWKQKRYDPISKTVPSKFFNKTARIISGIKLHDFNCGLKAYDKEVVKNIEVYGEMHRYIPMLAKEAGFKKIGEKIVQHQERKYGTTKFGMSRFINGFLDLLSVSFITKFRKKPMHLFGALGTLILMIGFFAVVYLGANKLYYIYHEMRAPLITDNPVFYIALVLMIIGVQLFLAGFLAELVARDSTDRNHYQIDEKI
ncbi:glycosyltransferase family 2 protein [Balneicella halophila]|uniref:glycosyltransferase family 2 protein n=1 Tax=Balneicella halophila TaxID=1537566 RepID=UPI000E301209|nr:glycosyltransferase family 2 protein [Balneicella halophila]